MNRGFNSDRVLGARGLRGTLRLRYANPSGNAYGDPDHRADRAIISADQCPGRLEISLPVIKDYPVDTGPMKSGRACPTSTNQNKNPAICCGALTGDGGTLTGWREKKRPNFDPRNWFRRRLRCKENPPICQKHERFSFCEGPRLRKINSGPLHIARRISLTKAQHLVRT